MLERTILSYRAEIWFKLADGRFRFLSPSLTSRRPLARAHAYARGHAPTRARPQTRDFGDFQQPCDFF